MSHQPERSLLVGCWHVLALGESGMVDLKPFLPPRLWVSQAEDSLLEKTSLGLQKGSLAVASWGRGWLQRRCLHATIGCNLAPCFESTEGGGKKKGKKKRKPESH